MARSRLAPLWALAITMGSTAAMAPRARAQVIAEPAPPPWPDPRKFAKGPFASGELGTMFFVGRAGRYTAPGVAFGARLGYDLFRWMALQGHVLASSADANLPPPTVGQSFQTYLFAGELRFTLQLRRFALFAEGGAAAAVLSNNVLDQVNISHGNLTSFATIGGAGLDYHTLNRHFSVGVGVDYLWMQAWNGGHGLSVDVYLRYTR